MYRSGDWDTDPRMPSNLLNSLLEYTTLTIDLQERVLALGDPAMLHAPFCYLSGHRLVQFDGDERRNFERYVANGGFVFVDDCNHDIDGLFARSRSRLRWRRSSVPLGMLRGDPERTIRSTGRSSTLRTARQPPRSSSTVGGTTWSTST